MDKMEVSDIGIARTTETIGTGMVAGNGGIDDVNNIKSINVISRKEPLELVDVTTLPKNDWHEWRRKGIGGSDLAAIMGVSPWSTARDVYYKKMGIVGALDHESDKENWVAKKVGHLLEPLVAEIFASQTGFEPYEIRKMFAHPDYPFMLANLDYLVTLPDGRTAIVECKTSNIHAKEKWADDAVPLNYELQCRHYMAVMNVDVVFIACLFGNNENDFLWRRIDRCLDFEADVIDAEEHFWNNHVLAGVEPPYTESGNQVLKSIRNFYGHGDTDADSVILPPSTMTALLTLEHLKAEKSKAKKVVDALDDKITKTQSVFVEQMGSSCKAVCKQGDDEFSITYNPVYQEDFNKEGLKANHPDIYDKFVTKKEKYRRLTVKRVVKKKVAPAA
ncbi:MAG: YqaJ viral recombinase family protein [Defluviitaleaceae bacterium]|nr:YqaJ viral recombinase family protein [Defluviitaleaceae bacterium]